MLQPEHVAVAPEAAEGFNAGEVIIEHVANSPIDHPLIHLPPLFGIDMSVTKHVLMVWIVAGVLLVVVTATVRRYLRQERLVPTGLMTWGLEVVVERMRDMIVEPFIGQKWARAYTPLLLTLFLFILAANVIGLIPIFDVAALLNHTVLHLPEESFFVRALHGGVTPTGNFNVTAALATISFLTIIIAGSRAHGFVQHWKNMVPHGAPVWLYPLLLPLEVIGMLVRPFALTMRLAANMTGGHIAIMAILSFVIIFAELYGRAAVGIGVGLVLSVPLGVGISMLEIIVVLVQAYVFTLLSAVFIGMAIHAHH